MIVKDTASEAFMYQIAKLVYEYMVQTHNKEIARLFNIEDRI